MKKILFKMYADQRCRWAAGLIFGFGLAGILFCLFANWRVLSAARLVFDSESRLDGGRVALVLGTSRLVRGRSNPYFRYRVEAAARLYQAGKASHLLLSGDNGRSHYNEPADMRDALLELGVPAAAMTLDFAGFRTLDSVVRAEKVFQAGPLVIVSQPAHCARAVYLARANGIDAVGFAAQDVYLRRARYRQLGREVLARTAAWLDVNLLFRQPRFLGNPEPVRLKLAVQKP